MKHNFDRITDVFYWPAIDMFVWGLTSSYLSSGPWKQLNIIVIIVSGLVFWTIAWRLPYETAIGLLDDIWNRNLVNIFVTPLRFEEWLTAVAIISGLKSFTSFVWSAVLAFLLFKVGLLSYGIIIIPFLFLLFLTGWTLGFIITALIFRFGQKVQAFAWTMGAIIMPFSAIYYPVKTLPYWAQIVSHVVPTSYIFENIRQMNFSHTFSMQGVVISLLLNIVYFLCAIFLLKASFKRVIKYGLNSLQT
jgi:ABC-2 type transport system permease protein